MMNNTLLTSKDIADILRVSYTTIRNKIRLKQIPYINLNKGGDRKVIRFDPRAIEAYIEAAEQKET